jgi:hypothetical protein
MDQKELSVVVIPQVKIPIPWIKGSIIIVLMIVSTINFITPQIKSKTKVVQQVEVAQASLQKEITKDTIKYYTQEEVNSMLEVYKKEIEDKKAIEAMVTNLRKIRKGTIVSPITSSKQSMWGKTKLHGFSLYEVLIWHLKAHEGFLPYYYPDGKFPSIGCGYNLVNGMEMLNPYLKDGYLDFQEGILLTRDYLEKVAIPIVKATYPNLNPRQQLAWTLHYYNTGNLKSLDGCCEKRIGCGSDDADVRKVHNTRRKYERSLYDGKLTKSQILADQKSATKIQSKWLGRKISPYKLLSEKYVKEKVSQQKK